MALVLPYRSDIRFGAVLSGVGVRAETWRAVMMEQNHTLGRGRVLVPAYAPGVQLTAGNSYEFRHRYQPSYQSLQQRWLVGMRTAALAASTDVEITFGGTSTHRVSGTRDGTRPAIHTRDLTGQSTTFAAVTIRIKPITADIIVESIAAVEVPRHELVNGLTNDTGHDATPYHPRQPILWAAGSEPKLRAVISSVGTHSTMSQRRNMAAWSVPSVVNGSNSAAFAFSTTSGTYVQVWQHDVPILLPKISIATAVGAFTAYVLAWASDGTTTGEVTTRSASGDTFGANAATVSGTTPTWYSVTGYDAHCDDLDSADGRQSVLGSPVWDEVNVGVRRTGGAGSIYVAGIHILALN